MHASVNVDTVFADLQAETGITEDEWRDIIAQPSDVQADLVGGWKLLGRMSWAAEPARLQWVLDAVTVAGTVAGVVGGVAGAVSAVAALRNL